MDVPEGCTCGRVVLNAGREVVGLDWHEDCPVHGIGSEWYETEGRARLEATRQRSIDLQMQAREARRKYGKPMICVECWEPIKNDRDLTFHSDRHRVGTEGLAIRACSRCVEKESGVSHPAHEGRCGMPTGRLGVVSCYCTHKEEA